MVKNLLLTIGLLILSLVAVGQADTWNAIVTNGFGSKQNYDVITFAEFKDTLYAGCGRVEQGMAELWKSGDGVNWKQVIYDPNAITVKGIPSMSTATYDDIEYMWIGTGSPARGMQIYRSLDGNKFIPISKKGFGNINGIASVPTPNMLLFQGTGDDIPYLYAAANSHGGDAKSTVWRTPYNNTDSSNWTLLIDFNSKDPDVTQVTYFYVWNNTLYMATNGDSLLYESTDGINFKANKSVEEAFLASDLLIANIIDYNGYLYVGTNNQSPNGGQLYRTPNGMNWTNITFMLPGHGGIEDEEIHDLDTSNGYLWVTVYTDTAHTTSGMPVWRSTDHNVSGFVQSNLDGFGNPDIDGENAVIIGFKGREYFGGPNYADGGQIWRTSDLTKIESIQFENNSVIIYPNPFSTQTTLYINKSLNNAKLTIYNISGQIVKSINNITGNRLTFFRDNMPGGLYFVRLMEDNNLIALEKLTIN